MAEGHAVIRWARTLVPLVGEPLERVTMPKRWGDRPDALVGAHVARVETRGKHLLLHLSDGQTLHTHGSMYGSWQAGERPVELRKPRERVRLGLLTQGDPGHEAVFYHGPTVELLAPDELAAHERLGALGPDVMAPTAGFEPGNDFDRAEAERRIRAQGERPVKQALIDQKVVAGVGNIFASESLFLARVDPLRRSDAVTDDELDALWPTLREMMWRGTLRWGRTKTTPPAMQAEGKTRWVYQRKGKPCYVCQTPIELLRLPPHDRATYRCPACQR